MKNFSKFLNDLKLYEGQRNEFNIGDLVSVKGKQNAILFNGEIGTITKLNNLARVKFDNRFNGNLHDGDGSDNTKCSYNIKYEYLELVNIDPSIRRFKISDDLVDILNTMKNEYVYIKLFLDLRKGVDKSILVTDPPDYLKLELDGTISYLKSRYYEEQKGNEWNNNRRTKVRASRVLKDIYNPEYMSQNLKETDINNFVNKWAAICSPAEVKEYRGEEILRAYNYTEECIPNFGYTCANFHQNKYDFGRHNEPTLPEYDVYVKNPENCGVAVVWDKGKIVARRSFQQGPNVFDSGKFIKDKIGTVYGNYYGLDGDGSKYDKAIIDYLEKKYDAVSYEIRDYFCIKMNTRFAKYCPFDSMIVCFEEDLLANRKPIIAPYNVFKWIDTYHAHCPSDLLPK